jgi:hypothetical protein
MIMKGADLMLPGLASLSGLENLKKGDMMGVRVAGNPVPFALGTSLTNWQDIEMGGRRGKALSVTHLYGDFLTPIKPSEVPNVGFGSDVICALEGYEENFEDDSDDDEEDDDEELDFAGGTYVCIYEYKYNSQKGIVRYYCMYIYVYIKC